MAKPRNIFAELNSPEPTSTCSSAPEDCETEDRARTRGIATGYFCRASQSRANFNTLYRSWRLSDRGSSSHPWQSHGLFLSSFIVPSQLQQSLTLLETVRKWSELAPVA